MVPPRDADSFSLLWLVAVILNVATALLALYLLYRLVRWALRLRLERRRQRAQRAALAQAGEFDVLEPAVVLAREMTADADAQREALATGSPRNAVVACWHRFETQAASGGVERRAWETSSEYTIRVLDLVDADAGGLPPRHALPRGPLLRARADRGRPGPRARGARRHPPHASGCSA